MIVVAGDLRICGAAVVNAVELSFLLREHTVVYWKFDCQRGYFNQMREFIISWCVVVSIILVDCADRTYFTLRYISTVPATHKLSGILNPNILSGV